MHVELETVQENYTAEKNISKRVESELGLPILPKPWQPGATYYYHYLSCEIYTCQPALKHYTIIKQTCHMLFVVCLSKACPKQNVLFSRSFGLLILSREWTGWV